MAHLDIRLKDGLVETRQLTKDRSFTIGSAPTADFVIDQKDILPRHCVIRWADRRYRLEVDPAANNVFVGVNPVTQLRLKPDAGFSITDIDFRLRYDPEELGSTLITDAALAESPQIRPLYRSPAFLGTLAGLIVLLLLATGLYFLVRTRASDKLYANSQKELNDGLYANAIASFDRFLLDYPNDPRVEEVRYLIGKSRVLEQTDTSAGSMTKAYDAAIEYAKNSPRFVKEHATENAGLFEKITRSLAEQAGQRTDETLLEKSRSLLSLMRSLLPEDALHPDTVAQMESLQAEAEQAVSQGTFINETIAGMDKAIADNKPSAVYEKRMEVLRRFPLLAGDNRLQDRLAQSATLEMSLVESRGIDQPTPVTPPVSPLPAVIRYARQAREGLRSGKVLLLGCEVGESVFGIDAGTGEIRWRTPIGPFLGPAPTQTTDAFPFSIVYRSTFNDLALLDVSNGKLVANLGLGKYRPHALCPLTLHGNRLFVVAKNDEEQTGFIAVIKTDDAKLAFDQLYAFPQPIHAAPAYDPRSESIFVLAEQATLYVVSLRDKSCKNVLPLGHDAEVRPSPPLVVGRLLLVPRNVSEQESHLNPYLIGDDAGSLTPKPSLNFPASIVGPMQSRQSRLFIETTAGLNIVDIGEPTDPAVLSLTAQAPGVDAALPVNENELWVVQKGKATQLSVSLTDKSLSPRGEVELLGHPLGAEFRSGKMLVVTASDPEQPSVQVTAIDNDSRTVAWTVRLAQFPSLGLASGRIDELPFSDGEATWLVDAATLAQGSIEALPLANPLQKPADARAWNVDPLPSVLYDAAGDELVLHKSGAPPQRMKWKRSLHLSAPARVLDGGLLLPTDEGALYWVDPQNGNERAEPFISSIGSAKPTPILAMTPIDPGDPSKGIALATADTLIKLNVASSPTAALAEASRVGHSHPAVRQLLVGKTHLWVVYGNAIVALNSAQWEKPIESPETLGGVASVVVNDLLIGCARQSEIVAFEVGDDGKIRQRWKASPAKSNIKSLLKQDDMIWAAAVDGKAFALSSDDGKVIREVDLRETILGAWIVGNRLVGITPDASLVSIELTGE